MAKTTWFLFIPLLLLILSCSPKWINGGWQGTGHQIDGQTWEVRFFANLEAGYEIDYPSLVCGGIWEVEDANWHKLSFVESIEYGQDHCDQGVEVTVTRISRTEIEVNYYIRSLYPEQPIATARLNKMPYAK